MPKSLEVKIFVADRTVYQGKARTIALRFFNGNLEVMSQTKVYYTSFDRGILTVSCGGSLVQYDLTLGFASSTGTELTVLAVKADRVTPASSEASAGPNQQNSAARQKRKTKYAQFLSTDV